MHPVSLQHFHPHTEPLFAFWDPKYITVFQRTHLSKSFESTWPHNSMSQGLYLWSLAIWSCIISLIMWLLIKHINHFIQDINFNDFITNWNYELLGKKWLHRIETTDTPETTIHFILFLFIFYHLLYIFSQFYHKSHFWIAVHENGYIY